MRIPKSSLPLDMPQGKPWTVYRFFASDGALLYVGVTGQWKRRLGAHQGASPWFGQVAAAELEHYATREEAAAREAALIVAEEPRHNRRRVVTLPPRSQYGDDAVRVELTLSRDMVRWLEGRAARMQLSVPAYAALLLDSFREYEQARREPAIHSRPLVR
jgi:predicted GIY-YIG superfamily endonuclease